MKSKKLKKTWRKLRHCTEHRLAACRDREVTILSEFQFDWWIGKKPTPHVTHLNLHDPELIIGVYAEGPIRKGIKKTGRVFIDLCNDKAWTLINQKGKILLHEEIQLKALHPGVIEPITRNANHQLKKLV